MTGRTVWLAWARVQVKFLVHRDHQDVYQITYTRKAGDVWQTTTHQMGYSGQPLVLIDDGTAKYLLQPPTEAEVPVDQE